MAKHNPVLSAADSARLDSWMVDIAADELGSVTESGDDYRVGANRSLVIHRTGAFHDFSAGIGGLARTRPRLPSRLSSIEDSSPQI